jgi:excisionase family DNA binding protein
MAAVALTLSEAAARLGVHYMTAYRYVRLGLLAAHKDGGTWRVDVADLDAFRAAASVVPDAAVGGAVADGGDRRRRAPWAQRLSDRLVAGDAMGAWGVIEAALAAGCDLAAIHVDVLTPAMWAIGDRWEAGEIDIADEHRASAIAMRLIGRLGPRFARRGRSRGVVVLANPQGERHFLALAMLADMLRASGFDPQELGADVPAASLGHAVRSADELVAVCLSVSGVEHLDAVREAISAVRATGLEVPVIVGGSAVRGIIAPAELGADHLATDGRDLVELVESHV